MSDIAPDAALRALERSFRDALRDIVREEVRAALAEPGRAQRNGAGHYLSIANAACVADVAPGTIRAWIRAGRLPARRAGRVYRVERVELDAFLVRSAQERGRIDTSAIAHRIAGH